MCIRDRLSRSLADRRMLGVGDRVEMLFVEAGDTPRRDRFKVAGIYSCLLYTSRCV